MSDVYETMKQSGITLPEAKPDGAFFDRVLPFGGRLLYTSGFSPNVAEEPPCKGKLGREYTTRQGAHFAANAARNVLAALEAEIGDLNRVKRVVKLLCFVASSPEFTEQALVADGASDILKKVFGEAEGKAARSAVGVAVLPNDSPVELEMLLELK